jgi:hypothetical protein
MSLLKIINLFGNAAVDAFADAIVEELPFRVRISAPQLKLNCWARVAWQDNEAAGLEFLPDVPVRD